MLEIKPFGGGASAPLFNGAVHPGVLVGGIVGVSVGGTGVLVGVSVGGNGVSVAVGTSVLVAVLVGDTQLVKVCPVFMLPKELVVGELQTNSL